MTLAPIERARITLGLTYVEIARALHVDESTLHRWRSGFDRRRMSAGVRAITGLTHLLAILEKRWPDAPHLAATWLDTPHPDCGGNTPRAWLVEGRVDYLAGLLTGEHAAAAAIAGAVPAARDVFDISPVGMARVALSGEFLAVNARLCEILGYTEQQLLALRGQTITHAEDLATNLEQALQLISGAVRILTLQKRYRHANGAVVWARVACTVVRDASGVPLHFLTVVEPLPDIGAAAC
ncbi:MAG: PAS domain S-box protein [bacterium]